ncbi:CDP-archaeol synthase, partial [Methanobrevibacter sp.]
VMVSFSITFVAIAVVLTLIIHLVANTGAYLIGIKDVWY